MYFPLIIIQSSSGLKIKTGAFSQNVCKEAGMGFHSLPPIIARTLSSQTDHRVLTAVCSLGV